MIYYFIGIKGSGMSALAQIMHSLGYNVMGSDKPDHFFTEKGLIEKLQNVVSHDFAVMTYTEAIDALKASGKDFQYPVEWGCDLMTEHERYISEEICKKPVFMRFTPVYRLFF